jgi:hypothetical protein
MGRLVIVIVREEEEEEGYGDYHIIVDLFLNKFVIFTIKISLLLSVTIM